MDDLPDYSSKKFMIVDDETFMQGLIDRMLRQCGATSIARVADGGAALRAIRDQWTKVDCIISDCNMKPINGLQLLQAVRIGFNPSIPRDQAFIMLTGYGDTTVVKSAVAMDVNGFLVKPVAMNKLVQSLQHAFSSPVKLKDPAYYKSIKLAELHTLNDDLDHDAGDHHKHSAWVVLSAASRKSNETAVKAKLAAFKAEHGPHGNQQEVKIRNRRKCSLDELTDGMILAEDVLADEDHILLKRGTRMNGSMIERLKELAADSESRDYVLIGELVS